MVAGRHFFTVARVPARARVVLGGALAALSCSSHPEAHPPALGDCVATHDAACTVPVVGGGRATGPMGGADASAADATSAGPDGASGGGDVACTTLQVASNTTCQACIQRSCCDVCTIDPICVQLAACAMLCSDKTCLGACQNQWPTAISSYDTYAACLAFNCSNACPPPP